MKRDLDLLRDILLKVESDGKLEIPGDHTDEEIAEHAQQLLDEDLAEGVVVPNRQGVPCQAAITRLKSAGHDFLGLIRNEEAWTKIKAYVADKLPGWTISSVKGVAERYASAGDPANDATESYCHKCAGDRTHEILRSHDEQQSFVDREFGQNITFGERSQFLKCKGCGFVSMRKLQWSSEMDYDDQPVWRYFPPRHSKPVPRWLEDLNERSNLPLILRCFTECYEAFFVGAVWIACVGVRSVLEQVMIEKIGDKKTFANNLKAFREEGYISASDESRLMILVEAGHASTHRSFYPKEEEVAVILDVLSNLLEKLYFDENKLAALRDRIPPRRP
jgi:hypothetical protein